MVNAFAAKERSSYQFRAELKDENKAAIPVASLESLTLTLTDERTNVVINSRASQNVLNANNVTVDANGVLIWSLQPEDNAIINTRLQMGEVESHFAVFKWKLLNGKQGVHSLYIRVSRVETVGLGTRVYSVQVNTAAGTALANAVGVLTTDITGIVAVQETSSDSYGMLTFVVAPGTYYLWVTHPNHTFTNPQTVVVA